MHCAGREHYHFRATALSVCFQAGAVHSDTSTCTQYYSGGWRTFAQDMELLPITYTFHFSDGTPDKAQAVVAGTTTDIH